MKHGECDHLTEYLILKGYKESIAASGLELFVGSWEEAVKWAVHPVSEVDIDYYHDLYQRTELYLVLQHAFEEQIEPYRERIEKADNLFKDHTIEDKIPCPSYINEEPDIEKHWWLFRVPKKTI